MNKKFKFPAIVGFILIVLLGLWKISNSRSFQIAGELITDFQLNDSINVAAGKYQLRAYTNWMRNFGDDFLFEKEIEISVNDFFIQPLDIVYVPRTAIDSIVQFLEQIYRGVLPPIDVYLRALWWTGGR